MKLTRDQIEAVRETLRSDGYKLIKWQQDMIMKDFASKLDRITEDHRYYQGLKEGARRVSQAPEILLARRGKN